MEQITESLAFPPSDSCNKRVKQEFLFGTSAFPEKVSLVKASTKCLHQRNETVVTKNERSGNNTKILLSTNT
jgi:hypothetical protein